MLKILRNIILILMCLTIFPYLGYAMFKYADRFMPYYILLFIALWYSETWIKLLIKNKKYKPEKELLSED